MARYVIGIDEVGRGALAGPVVVAAACVKYGMRSKASHLGKLKDSKKLSPLQREKWLQYFKGNSTIIFAVARVYPRQIEKRNISGAANLAAIRAYEKIIKNLENMEYNGSKKFDIKAIYLDGGLFVKSRKYQEKAIPEAKTFPKADETVPVVAIASIVAKVDRDRLMQKLAKQYPEYGFEIHKGYGTKLHLDALKKSGLSVLHRTTFCKTA